MHLPGLVKVTLIKDQEELVVIVKPVDSVGNTLGEVPNVTVAELLDLVDAILINSRDNHSACIHEAPFGLSQC